MPLELSNPLSLTALSQLEDSKDTPAQTGSDEAGENQLKLKSQKLGKKDFRIY